jgi:hypothetical protein
MMLERTSSRIEVGDQIKVSNAGFGFSAPFHEIQLIDGSGNIYDRARLTNRFWESPSFLKFYNATIDTHGIKIRTGHGFAYPDVLKPVAPSEADWIDDDDPLRSLAVWAPTCNQLDDPKDKPELTFVRFEITPVPDVDPISDNGEITFIDQGDYVQIDGIYVGYPFFVEARFEVPQETEAFEVTMKGYRIKLTRTENDPLVYRSTALIFSGQGIVEGTSL